MTKGKIIVENMQMADASLPRAGTQSGFVTTLRISGAGDKFLPPGSFLSQYEGTHRFNAVPNTLQKGQVTAHGVLLASPDATGKHVLVEPPNRFAITGGTQAYDTARGQITEGDPNYPALSNPAQRLLEIQL
jgi:hypothetical protein